MLIPLINMFSILLLFSAVMVVATKNPLHSVLSLVSSFLFASLLIFLSGNEFLALFFLIIYLGAIAILFLFVVMMLDIKYHELQTSRLYFPSGLFIGGVLCFETLGAFSNVFSKDSNLLFYCHNVYQNWYDSLDAMVDISVIGQVFYTQYLLQILIAGLILYIAVIGVAFLTISGNNVNTGSRGQSLSKQLARKNIL